MTRERATQNELGRKNLRLLVEKISAASSAAAACIKEAESVPTGWFGKVSATGDAGEGAQAAV